MTACVESQDGMSLSSGYRVRALGCTIHDSRRGLQDEAICGEKDPAMIMAPRISDCLYRLSRLGSLGKTG